MDTVCGHSRGRSKEHLGPVQRARSERGGPKSTSKGAEPVAVQRRSASCLRGAVPCPLLLGQSTSQRRASEDDMSVRLEQRDAPHAASAPPPSPPSVCSQANAPARSAGADHLPLDSLLAAACKGPADEGPHELHALSLHQNAIAASRGSASCTLSGAGPCAASLTPPGRDSLATRNSGGPAAAPRVVLVSDRPTLFLTGSFYF
jgi:hypothetical protein